MARFAQALSADSAHLSRLNDSELRAWERLCKGPLDLEAANMDDRDLARAIARLERKGLAIYTGTRDAPNGPPRELLDAADRAEAAQGH